MWVLAASGLALRVRELSDKTYIDAEKERERESKLWTAATAVTSGISIGTLREQAAEKREGPHFKAKERKEGSTQQ